MDQSIVKKTIDEVQGLVKDNKVAIAASAAAYYLSKNDKERNALIAGLLAYAFLENKEEETK
jgi:hypothetical protein